MICEAASSGCVSASDARSGFPSRNLHPQSSFAEIHIPLD